MYYAYFGIPCQPYSHQSVIHIQATLATLIRVQVQPVQRNIDCLWPEKDWKPFIITFILCEKYHKQRTNDVNNRMYMNMLDKYL